MIAFWKPCAKRSSGARGLLLLGGALLLSSCSGLQKVERRRGDQVEAGRRVPSRAYAWYARARYLHRQGELELAREAYQQVLAADAGSGAAYAGLGATYCDALPDVASETFARGLRRADEKVPIYIARGRCELLWGQPRRALASARDAFAHDPASLEVSLLLEDALIVSGQATDAARVKRARRLYLRQHEPSPAIAPTRAAVDLALLRGDLRSAEALSLEVMPRSSLSVRALALGHTQFARDQAALVAGAAPEDLTARVVLTLTTGPSGRAEDLTQGALVPNRVSAPDELATCLLAEHVRTNVGAEAAQLILGAVHPSGQDSAVDLWQKADDPLLARCARRLAQH